MDDADFAILETYENTMNAVERGLLQEIRRLRLEIEEKEGDLRVTEAKLEQTADDLADATRDVERLEDRVRELSRVAR